MTGPNDRVVTNKRRLGLPILGWTVRSSEDAARAKTYCDNCIFEGYRPAV